MDQAIKATVLAVTGARAVVGTQVIQSLWSGYGELRRLELAGGSHTSIILKHIKLPDAAVHPRGWNTNLSHQRKIRSYQVEAHWYQHHARHCDTGCVVPKCLAVESAENETLLLLTDLDELGFDLRKEQAGLEEMYACLDWLAQFHARFMGSRGDGLWESGTYWHLQTRPDELEALDDLAQPHVQPVERSLVSR